jgi:hypothetical protein
MINRTNVQIAEDKESQYLEETRRYIESLKNSLIKKILSLHQGQKNENKIAGINQSTNRGN